MPAFNHNSSLLGVSGVNHRFTNVAFTTGTAGAVTSFGGAFVQSVVHSGVGIYSITLAPFTPRALVSAAGRLAAGGVRSIRIGAVVIDPVAKTTTLDAFTSGAIGIGLADASGLAVVITLHWKMFSGTDRSGL